MFGQGVFSVLAALQVVGNFTPPKTLGASKNSVCPPRKRTRGRRRARRRHRPATRLSEAARARPGGGVGWVQLGSRAKPSPEPGPDPPWPPPGPDQRNSEMRGPARGAPSRRGRSSSRQSWPRPGDGRGAGWGRCPRGCGLALSPGHGQAPTTLVLAGWRSNL